jgi:peptide/nickel transport system ATP-binding protein
VTAPLLEIEGLRVRAANGRTLVNDVAFRIAPAEAFALVGASGSGKSTVCSAVLGLPSRGADVAVRRALFAGEPLFAANGAVRPGVLGRRIGAVFQDPRGSLTPHLRIRAHVLDSARATGAVDDATALRKAVALLDELHVSRPQERLDAYPHELSGGLCQRVALALALLHDPELLVADEPTTALDPVSQAVLLRLLVRSLRARGAALLIVTHDLGVVAAVADRVAVMEQGTLVETATVAEFATRPVSEPARRLVDAARAAAAGEFR